jgi:hypothetical protein
MAKCTRCGAQTALFINAVPICVNCDSVDERDAKPREQKTKPSGSRQDDKATADRQTLLLLYGEATRKYRRDVKRLAKAAGSLELDMFLRLQKQCDESHRECIELRQQLSRL